MNLDEVVKTYSVAEHCLKIYRGELPDSECLNCVYKHLGVDCVLALIEAQHKIITEILEKQNVHKSKNTK